jgi:glycine cleavage system H protein
MKELSELVLPEDRKYTSQHEWVMRQGETVTVGITDFAQDQLGDIVFVELPEAGGAFEAGEEFSTLESVKAVSEVYMPISGEIVEVNETLVDSPELINQDPYSQGWIVTIAPKDPAQVESLMDKAAYLEMLKGEA